MKRGNCIDCKFFYPAGGLCLHDNAQEAAKIIWGVTPRAAVIDVASVRLNISYCGPDGSWWEEK
jgi:hypothetical protein